MLHESQSVLGPNYMDRAREVFIRMCLIGMMAITCYLILKPFLLLILWSIILAIAVYPAYRMINRLLGGRETISAAVCTALLLALIIVPAVLLTGTLVDAVQSLATKLRDGTFAVPPAPEKIENMPIIGAPLKRMWDLASTNLGEALSRLSPYLKQYVPKLFSASAALGGTLLQFILSILLSGFLLANGKTNAILAHSLFGRIFHERSSEFEQLTESTIRSVTNGILGVAVIQSVFAGAGFLAVGLPGAGMWAAMFLLASVLQIGPLVMIPAVAYAFTITSTGHAVLFLIWCIVVGAMDNILKPLMLGRSSKVPTGVIFVGVIGGFVAMGIVGLFVGGIILSVGYKLFLAWLAEENEITIAQTATTSG